MGEPYGEERSCCSAHMTRRREIWTFAEEATKSSLGLKSTAAGVFGPTYISHSIDTGPSTKACLQGSHGWALCYVASARALSSAVHAARLPHYRTKMAL